jgi:hypothetical protein
METTRKVRITRIAKWYLSLLENPALIARKGAYVS